MSTNLYFNNWEASGEQYLIEDLIIESIKMYGMDMWYIPRTLGAKDELLNEDDLSTFDDAYQIEMYIKNIDNFEGEGDFLSKFGLQIRDSMTLTVAIRVFDAEVGGYTTQVRPKEGDVIFLPLNGKMFEVKHTEHEAIFYQLGALQVYDLNVELFEYSGERFNTGVAEIDERYDDYDFTANSSVAVANVESIDAFADNFTIEAEADLILDFSQENPFGENTY